MVTRALIVKYYSMSSDIEAECIFSDMLQVYVPKITLFGILSKYYTLYHCLSTVNMLLFWSVFLCCLDKYLRIFRAEKL